MSRADTDGVYRFTDDLRADNMKRFKAIKTRSVPALALAGAALGACVPAATAAGDPFDGHWHYSVTPYLWLPNINAKLNYEIGDRAVNEFQTRIGPNDYLEHLKFAVMLTGEVRKGEWSAFTDIIYLDLGNENTRVRTITGPRSRDLGQLAVQASTSLSSTVWTLAGAYSVMHDPTWNLDVLLGFRYLGLDTEFKWAFADTTDWRRLNLDLDRAGRRSANREQWDAIIGLKGQVRLGQTDWFVPYYVDVGTGDSNLTWQALLGVGYRFGWGDVTLSIRSLSYQFEQKDTDLRLTGPALGVSFRW
jgi:hypothetical protein